MTDDAAFLAETTALLERTPRVLRELLGGTPDSWLDTADTPGGWQPRDVVGHLISAELTDWIERAEVILNEGTERPFDRLDRFAHAQRDQGTPLDDLIDRFAEMRATNLARLAEIVSVDDLDRRGLHPTLGEVTLRQLLSTWAVHDLDHTAQVFAGMAGSHAADVGPWREYLGILLRREDPAAMAG